MEYLRQRRDSKDIVILSHPVVPAEFNRPGWLGYAAIPGVPLPVPVALGDHPNMTRPQVYQKLDLHVHPIMSGQLEKDALPADLRGMGITYKARPLRKRVRNLDEGSSAWILSFENESTRDFVLDYLNQPRPNGPQLPTAKVLWVNNHPPHDPKEGSKIFLERERETSEASHANLGQSNLIILSPPGVPPPRLQNSFDESVQPEDQSEAKNGGDDRVDANDQSQDEEQVKDILGTVEGDTQASLSRDSRYGPQLSPSDA